MITYEQAINENNCQFHEDGCKKVIGPRGGVKTYIVQWRRNGKTMVWKTRPGQFTIPIKYGFRTYGYLHDVTAYRFHLDVDCPLLKENEKMGVIDRISVKGTRT